MRNYIGNNNEINKKKYKKSLPPKLNPDAGNVEHNIDMFNKASSGDANLSSSAGMNGMAESYDRENLIARITEFGKHYNFDKYTDAQLNAMLNRLVDASNHRKKILPKHQDRINIQSERHIMNDDPSYNFDDPEREGEYRVENLREALNRLDHYCIDNDKTFYDLRSLYENIQHQLTPQEKQELKKLVDTTNDPDAIKAYIDSKDPQKKNEELDEGVFDTLKAKRQARLDKIDAKKRAEDPLYDKMRSWEEKEQHKDDPIYNFVYDQKFKYSGSKYGVTQVPKNVVSAIIKNNAESISPDAFKDCTRLKDVKFENKIITIGKRAFMNCTSLTNMELPETVHTIEDEAFRGCSNLEHLTIPNQKVRIGKDVFEGCTKLQKNKNESLKLKNKYNEAINSNYRVDTWIDNSDKITPSKLKKEISSYPEGTYLRLCRKGAINAMNQYTYGFVKVEPDQWVAYSSIVGLSNNTPLTDYEILQLVAKYNIKNLGVKINNSMVAADWSDETDVDFDESLNEDTVKQGNKWVNKGKEGTHGKFKTKKAADAQRKAMFANGYKGESLEESFSGNLKVGKTILQPGKTYLTMDDDYYYDDINSIREWEDVVNTVKKLGWVDKDGSSIIIPQSTKLTYIDSSNPGGAGYFNFYINGNKDDQISFSTDVDEDIEFISNFIPFDGDLAVADWSDDTDIDFDESLKLKESSPVNYKKKISLIREIDRGIPYSMRYKEADIVDTVNIANDYDNDELILYWVTEDPFTKDELQEFAFYATECCHDIYDDIMQIALTYRGISKGFNSDDNLGKLIWIDAAGEWRDEDWDDYVNHMKKVGVDVEANDLIAADWEDSTDFDFDESLKLKKKRR